MKRFLTFTLALLMLLSLLPSALADSPHTHNWKEKSRVEPTCTKDGYAVYTCSCGARKTETLPALGHEYSKQVYTSYADCTHYGVFYWVCERCSAHSPTGNDKPLGHDWDEGKVIKKPTATEDGKKVYTCKRDPSHTMTEALPATGEGGIHPSLKLAIFGDYELRPFDDDHFSGVDVETGIDASINMQLTNTGDVPLYIIGCSQYDEVDLGYIPHYAGHDSGNQTLAAAEVYNDINTFNLRDANPWYGYDIDRMKSTPEDPFYEAKVTISFWYLGYESEDACKDEGIEPLCQSNVCTFTVYIPREGAIGEPTGLGVMKTEAHGPANGEYYELGETIDYVITLTNDSGSDLKDLAVYDSLAGFEPIATAESFAQGETLKFEYSAVVTDEEITKAQAVNSAVVTFTYGDGASATPRFSNWVYSKTGNTETPETAHFDKAKLDAVPEFSSDAETAEQWNAEAEKLYTALWEAGDDLAKCAVLEERAMFFSYLEALESKTDDAASFRRSRSEALWERLASLAGITDTEAVAVPVGLSWEELIAETLRLKCVQLLDLINELP